MLRSRDNSWVVQGLWAAAVGILIAGPAAMVDVPAMVDYPNHLARMHLLVSDYNGAAQHPFYAPNWKFSSNLAMDLLIPVAAQIIHVELATRLFYVISLMLIASGAIALEYAVKRTVCVSIFVAMALLYSRPFTLGLLNFQFGLGLALWGIAAWIWATPRPMVWRILIHITFVAALFLSHLLALGVYGLALGLLEISFWRRRSLKETATWLALLAAPPMALAAIMVVAGGQVGDVSVTGWRWLLKLASVLHFFSGYNLEASALAVCIVCLLFVIHRKKISLTGPGALIVTVFVLLAIAIPTRLLNAAGTTERILVAGALIMPAFLTFNSRGAARWFAGFAIAVAVLNAAHVSYVWASHAKSYGDLKASFGRLHREARVLVVSGESIRSAGEFPMLHAPTLAVHYAQAFVPTFFAEAGKQPIAAREPHRFLVAPDTGPWTLADLEQTYTGLRDETPAFLRNWPNNFDYLYVVGPQRARAEPSLLEEITGGDRFRLYRIRRLEANRSALLEHVDLRQLGHERRYVQRSRKRNDDRTQRAIQTLRRSFNRVGQPTARATTWPPSRVFSIAKFELGQR